MQQRETRSAVSDGTVKLSRNSKAGDSQQYKVLNISRGGLCFASVDTFELNEQVKLDITIKDKSILTANGRVCYRNETDGESVSSYGLSFLDNFIDADFIRSQK